MCRLYLKEQGSKVSCEGRRIVISKDDKVLLEVPIHRIDEIVVEGRVAITIPALTILLDRQVPLTLASTRGRFRGILSPPFSPGVNLRKQLYKASDNNQFVMDFARDVVHSKIINAGMVLRRYFYNHGDQFIREKAQEILDVDSYLNSTDSVDSLRGYEGTAARLYFAALVAIFASLNVNFSGRIRRPPTDPVNSVLSYIYILLTSLVSTKIQIAGLDVFCGIMHKPNRNAPALALDLVEQFRQPIADRFVMLMFNRKQLTADDFEQTKVYPAMIKEKSKNRLIENWEDFLATPQTLLSPDEKITPEKLMELKIDEFAKSLLSGEKYHNFTICK